MLTCVTQSINQDTHHWHDVFRSMVIEHIMPVDPDCVGTYFYYDRTDATLINVSNILRSLLAQLLFCNPRKTKPLLARLQKIRLTGANLPSHPCQLQDYIVEAASYWMVWMNVIGMRGRICCHVWFILLSRLARSSYFCLVAMSLTCGKI